MIMSDFDGKIGIVTGGIGSIGKELVASLRGAGATIEVFDIAAADPVDITCERDVSNAFGRVVDRHGRLDFLFSNAGFLRAGDTETFAVEDFDRTVAVNLRGAFLAAKAAIPHLKKSSGAMVFTSSTSGLVGAAGEAAYAAAKAGIIGLTRSLAAELAKYNIRVNAIAPGWVDTPFNDPLWLYGGVGPEAVDANVQMVPMRRQASAAELVPAMLFLASSASAYMTGQVLTIDGGLTAIR